MRSMSASLKTDMKSEKDIKIIEEFVLKLPANNSHRYHVIEGEVHNYNSSIYIFVNYSIS